MKKPLKIAIVAMIMACGTAGPLFGHGQPTAAASRRTSALQQTNLASISTRRVALRPMNKLHMVVTAYDQNGNICHHQYSYRLFRNGRSVDTGSFSDGHMTRAIKVKPGNYSLRVYNGQKQVTFSGGISTSNQPHFV